MIATFLSTYFSRVLLLLSVLSIGAYTVAFPGTASWTLFFFIVLAIIGTYGTTLYLIKKLTVSVVSESDGSYTLQLTMHTFPFTVVLLPMLHAHIRFAGMQTDTTISSAGKSVIEWRVPLRTLPRGMHKQVIVVFSGTDIFGLFRSVKKRAISVEIPIYPRALPANITQSLINQVTQVIRPFQVAREVPHEIKQIRPFLQRDSVHSIDWKSSARVNSLMVKEFEPPLQLKLVLLFLGATDEFFEETLRMVYSLQIELAKKYPLTTYLGGSFDSKTSYQTNRFSYVTVEPTKEVEALLAKRPLSRNQSTFTIVCGPQELEATFSSKMNVPYLYLHTPRVIREEAQHETNS